MITPYEHINNELGHILLKAKSAFSAGQRGQHSERDKMIEDMKKRVAGLGLYIQVHTTRWSEYIGTKENEEG
jgi:hypothetical protein